MKTGTKDKMLEAVETKVCNGCGGKLIIKPIRENSCFTDHKEVVSDELVCEHCSKLCWGVDKKDFELARKLVMEFGYTPYPHMDKYEYKEKEKKYPNEGWMAHYWESQISGAYSLIYWLRENKDLITQLT